MEIYKCVGLAIIVILLASCKDEPQWIFEDRVPLDEIHPIGIIANGDNIWLSDGDNNRIVVLDSTMKIIETYDGFARPMHLDLSNGKVYIPEYGTDTVRTIDSDGNQDYLSVLADLDAPAGIDVNDDRICIADFYGHQIAYFNSIQWITIGGKGTDVGELLYPTDCEVANGKLYIADAYNNRIQIFDNVGSSLQTIGANEDINAATGIYLHEDQIFITDFENGRVLIYTEDGALVQILEDGINKPTDLIIHNSYMIINDFENSALTRYKFKA